MRKFYQAVGMMMASLCLCAVSACGGTPPAAPPSDKVEPNCTVEFAQYQHVKEVDDLVAYQGDVATNLPVQNGVIVSPYYTLKLNGTVVPVYATRTANGIHSFAYVDVAVTDAAKPFALAVEIAIGSRSTVLSASKPNVTVLPESTGVTAALTDRTVTATVTKTGSYSFVFNRSHKEALTLFVAEKEDTAALFGDYRVQSIEPDDYSTPDTRNAMLFTEGETVYYFKAGRYQVDMIRAPSNSLLYFERGAYLEVMAGSNRFAMYGVGENVRIAGRGLIDMSACCGGEEEQPADKSWGLVFDGVKDISFSGMTVINSMTWTLCMNACQDVQIDNCLFFAYRVFADGIMLSDCKNAVVEDNFIRTGDDAFETKSVTASGLTQNVLFQNNAAWTDKAVAYGCIYESVHDTSDVTFKNCSVGFALGVWSNHLGCCVIQLGDRKGCVIENITFDNIEIYHSDNAGILNCYIGGSGGRGPGYGIIRDIYFRNITVRRNSGAFLNVRTYDSDNCFIYDLYLDNIVSNGVQLTPENYRKNGYITNNAAGYDLARYVHINTRDDA